MHFTVQTPRSLSRRQIGTPQRGSSIRIKNVQEATQAVAQSKYRESLGVLEVSSKNFSNNFLLSMYCSVHVESTMKRLQWPMGEEALHSCLLCQELELSIYLFVYMTLSFYSSFKNIV